MKIAIMSDLHLEMDASAENFPIPAADLLILAGDIHAGTRGIDWVTRHAPMPAIMVAGNHELYGFELFHAVHDSRVKAAATGGRVVFLERNCWEAPGAERVKVIGAMLWTDFALYGTPPASMCLAGETLDDFKKIEIERGHKLRTLRPADTVRLHAASVDYLGRELGRAGGATTIVVTHHAPSPRSVSPAFRESPLNPAFVTDLEHLIRRWRPALWIHGHVHASFDYRLGGTRIVCNPRGYAPAQLNPDFDPHLVIDTSEL